MPDQPRCIYELPSPVHLCSTFPTASVHLWSTPCAVHTPMRLSQCIYVVTYPTASVHLWSTHCAVSTCIYVVTFYNTTMHYLPKCIEAVTTTLCIYPNESMKLPLQCSASMQHFPQCICALLHPCIHAFEYKNESIQYLPHCIYAVQYLHQCFNGVAVPTLTRKCSLLRSELSRHNLDSCHSLQQRNPSRQNSVDDATPGTLYQGHGNDSLNKDRI